MDPVNSPNLNSPIQLLHFDNKGPLLNGGKYYKKHRKNRKTKRNKKSKKTRKRKIK